VRIKGTEHAFYGAVDEVLTVEADILPAEMPSIAAKTMSTTINPIFLPFMKLTS
jgi:hypothetical protein